MIINILFVSGLALLLTRSKPVILIRRFLGLKEENYDNWGELGKFLYDLISCAFCLSFHIGMIYGLTITTLFISFKIAVISSLISFLIDENL